MFDRRWIVLVCAVAALPCCVFDEPDDGTTNATNNSSFTNASSVTMSPTTADDSEGDTTDTAPTSSGEQGEQGEQTGEPSCYNDIDCAGAAGECRVPACNEGVCEFTPYAEGTELPDEPNNCRASACDAVGNAQSLPDDGDVPLDEAGNCKSAACVDGNPRFPPDDLDLGPDQPGNCRRAACTAGQPGFAPDDLDLPDDGVECSEDLCVAGEVQHPMRPVNTFCGADGELYCNAAGDCQMCRQADDLCLDPGSDEPNDTILLATEMPGAGGDDDAVQSFCGILVGDEDVDWYTFHGSTGWFDAANPVVYTIAPEPHRTCMYVHCPGGDTMVDCVDDDIDDVSPVGDPGCCGADNKVAPYINCDSAQVYARIDNPDALACVGYELRYHF